MSTVCVCSHSFMGSLFTSGGHGGLDRSGEGGGRSEGRGLG